MTASPPKSSPHVGRGLAILAGAALIAPVGLYCFTLSHEGIDFLYALGQLSGLVGLALGLTQPLGMSATAARLYGAQKMRIHKGSGMLCLSLLLLHPGLLALSEGDGWMFALDAPWAVQLGKLALAVMVLAAGSFFLIRFKLLKFPLFSRIHTLAYPAALLGLVHAFYAGTSLRASPALLAYYLILAGLSLACFLGLRWRRWHTAAAAGAR